MKKRIPIKITPDLIVECLVEIQFSTTTPEEVVFASLYNPLKKKYPKLQRLPILQIPEVIRRNDPSLTHKAHQRLHNNQYSVQIGPRVVSLSSRVNYEGWKVFSQKAIELFSHVKDADIVTGIPHLGLRYINFFDRDIYPETELSLTLEGKSLFTTETGIRVVQEKEGFFVMLSINNHSTQKDTIKGSIIDVDVMLKEVPVSVFDNMAETLNSAHRIEKETFFGILKQEFIDSLNPEYDD